jgi:aminoglycoside phosphotransferase (APT) family kinase protein
MSLTPADHRAFITATFPSIGPITGFQEIAGGWDSYSYLVNESWIFQLPRPAAPPGWFAGQVRLLGSLRGRLPSAIPDPQFISEAPLCMGYRRIDGIPANRAAEGEWPEQLGTFLRRLHAIDPAEAGLPPGLPGDWRKLNRAIIQEFQDRVVPLLTRDERRSAETLFAAFVEDHTFSSFSPVVVHRDLGPEHILVTSDGRLAGVIDWGDAQLGDPAIDFSWLLFGSPAKGERALSAYGETSNQGFRRRALFYHQLGPWHEVSHGIDTGQPAFVETGLAGVRARLPRSE